MRRAGILPRIVLLTSAVATVAVLVAGLISFPLIRGNAQALALDDLSRLSGLTASALRVGPGGTYVLPPRVSSVLQAEQVTAYVVSPGATELPDGVTVDDVAAVTSGSSVAVVVDSPAGQLLVAGRPLEPGIGVLLVQPSSVAGSTAAQVLWRLVLALLIGLVIAIVVAVVAAGRITRPLRSAAEAAHRLGGGERGVGLRLEGPAEVAEIAEALNRLSAALAVSEGRQREFLLSVSHELRTPITSIRGYAQALADGLVDIDDVGRSGAVMTTEALRLDRLVSDLLDLARLRADDFRITPVSIDLGAIAREATQVWADRCARVGIEFASRVPERPVIVMADPIRLRQIVDNLAENALRVAPEDTHIAMDVGTDSPWGTLTISDSGPGLLPDDLAVAFEPGILHERYRGLRPVGTGLGLAIVGRLAQGMGGWARAAVASEGGAAFTVGVPLVGHASGTTAA
ncbi:MAG: HAMP domain-containing histidine kinase [Actinobacteria bacterium]|nr:HAMP domain-containing histidine kinase [Actinomycetota bacterium]